MLYTIAVVLWPRGRLTERPPRRLRGTAPHPYARTHHIPISSTVPSCGGLPAGDAREGLLATFSEAASAELQRIQAPAVTDNASPTIRDLTGLLWASIDNDDSRDLDQLTAAETLPGDAVKILVAVADVDALVKDGSAIDSHARHNTTSVYTAAGVFPMLPEKLSTDLRSLNPDQDRDLPADFRTS